MKIKTLKIAFLIALLVLLCQMVHITYLYRHNLENRPNKGQHFDLRGGSTVIEVNTAEKVVWFRCDSDSTYFYEPFTNIGIQ
jgi:hypothetical protein